MALVDALATVALSLLLPPFLVVLVSVLVLASFGKSLGLRQKYVEVLLKVFEDGNRILVKKFGKERLAKNSGSMNEDSDSEDEARTNGSIIRNNFRPFSERDDDEVANKHEFELGDCLDYISAGMEAIVDDEVTKRFSAEELTSWNLLTRTNCHYEFISVRLTIFWVVGFLVRYFLLLPLRITILLFGVGQRHGGFLGIFQRALSRASAHIWFERCEAKDRFAVAKRLRDHVEDPDKLPILIFPEGTCINNTSVMQFKKGTFEVGGIIYPVAIKYDPRFGDAFWNSSKYSMVNYIYMMMTSWAIVCDVWYLPPMTIKENETSIEFANRVKAEIARQGGLVDLVWDGGLKRSAPKKEWKEQHQQEFSRRLKVSNLVTEKKVEKCE
ncbi:glycerol-3-phosphate acyltransferase 4 isoform X4 [Oratosquilla oratoria]|uniref:glycerol-3-phosphate acyltransferase 4 isoform X4 n=1 Tax=Oratosquilla oratoria TaxID=337810 RepID=UPI003F7673BD